MKGLEISIITFKEAFNTYRIRFDAEYYKKEYLINDSFLIGEPIGKYCNNYTRIINKDTRLKKNYNYLEISGVNTDNLNYSTSSLDFIPDRATYILQNNDIAVSTVRPNRNAVAFIQNANRLIGTSGFTVLRTSSISPYLLYVFCKTKFFITKLIRENTATMYPAVTDYDVNNVNIPFKVFKVLKDINGLIKLSIKKQEHSKLLYTQAEELLLEELGLKDWKPQNETTSIKTLKESFLSSGRLDAEYYQKKYDEKEKNIKYYKGGYKLIQDYFRQNISKIDFDKKEYNYIEIGDINISDGSINYNIVPTEELPANAKIELHKNDLLISTVRPYRGAVAILYEEIKDAIGSGAFTVLQEKTTEYKKETLMVLLRTSIYKDLLLKFNVGTSYPVIKDEDVLNLPIPIINKETQQKIANKIQESFRLRRESKDLLQKAVKIVENEIEKGE